MCGQSKSRANGLSQNFLTNLVRYSFETGLSIIAATVPTIRPLFRKGGWLRSKGYTHNSKGIDMELRAANTQNPLDRDGYVGNTVGSRTVTRIGANSLDPDDDEIPLREVDGIRRTVGVSVTNSAKRPTL